jgi:glycine oxidase
MGGKAVVIGGGVMGLACAWRLGQVGMRVELFEKKKCGAGATGAALGALWPPSPLARGPLQEMHRKSLWGFEAFVREVEAAGGERIAYRRGGRIELLATEKAEMRAREEAVAACAEWPGFGGDDTVMEVVRGEDVGRAAQGVEGRGMAALVCRATGQVRVEQLVAGLAAACRRAGVVLREGEVVRSKNWRWKAERM